MDFSLEIKLERDYIHSMQLKEAERRARIEVVLPKILFNIRKNFLMLAHKSRAFSLSLPPSLAKNQ